MARLTTFLRDDREVIVDFTYTPECPATWEDPGNGAEVEIDSIRLADGTEVVVSDEEAGEIEERCLESIPEDIERERDDAAADRHYWATHDD